MAYQVENSKRLKQHIQKAIESKLDDLFVEPNAEYAEDIKQSICEKATKFLEESCPDGSIINTQVNPAYYPNDETLAIDIKIQMNKPIDTVDVEITKPEAMTDNEFEHFINCLQEEIESIDYGTSNKILQND